MKLLRAAIHDNPALAEADRNWESSVLLDLAFSLETRLGNLAEILKQVNESLYELDQEFAAERATLHRLVKCGISYNPRNKRALRRTIIGLNSFVTEARSFFENLAQFYRAFVAIYFNERISEQTAYTRVAQSAGLSDWADSLRLLRHDILHERSPWLRFKVGSSTPRFEPALILEYRIEHRIDVTPNDEVSLEYLARTREYLHKAYQKVGSDFIERVKTYRPDAGSQTKREVQGQ